MVTRRQVWKKKTKSTLVWRGKKGRGSVINMTRISERKENGTQDTFEDIMTRNFPDLMTDIRLWTDTRSLMNPKQNNYNPPLIIFQENCRKPGQRENTNNGSFSEMTD